MNTCDIDKLRDLVRRQYRAKYSYFETGWSSMSQPLAEIDIERQVNTYLAQGTTVAALTKCVETIEAEAKVRIKEGKEAHEEMERKERILRVCEQAMDPKKDTYEIYSYLYSLDRDVARIKKDLDA